MSIPSRVLISSNNSKIAREKEYDPCQSLQGFSYLLTRYIYQITSVLPVSIPSRVLISSNNSPFTKQDLDAVCQSLQGFSYLLTLPVILLDKDDKTCQSLQGFSYLLTQMQASINECSNTVSIPSRVLISSNTVPAIPLFLYAHTSLCGADLFFSVSSHHYTCQNAFQPSIHAMRG